MSFLSNLRVRTRFLAILAAAALVVVALASFMEARSWNRAYESRLSEIGNVVELADSVAKHFHRLAESGAMTEDDAKAAAFSVNA